MRTMNIQFLAVVFLMSFASAAHAKCPFFPYVFTGVVYDETSKQPVPRAKIMVFLDNQTKILADGGYAKKYPDFVTTNDKGVFAATSHFQTYSGHGPQGDECGKIPERLEIVVLAPGYLAHRELVDYSTVKENKGQETVEVNLKPIYVERPRHEQ